MSHEQQTHPPPDAAQETSTPPAHQPQGATLAQGRYLSQRLLGMGGEKLVYLVRDLSLERLCAFSLLNVFALDENTKNRLRREARAMGRLGSHPHLVTVYDIGEEDGQPFIVTEYLPGGDLRKEIVKQGGRLSLQRTLEIALQLLDALAYVHDHEMVHRDVKPENIWLTADKRIKLGDFGLAVLTTDSRIHEAGKLNGTPRYISPEQLSGTPLDGRADLYALGCLLYECTTGQPPFTGTLMSVLGKHLHQTPKPPQEHNPSIPQPLNDLILCLLEKSPEDRPPHAAAAAQALSQSLPHSQSLSSATPPTPIPSLNNFIHLPFIGRQSELEQMDTQLAHLQQQPKPHLFLLSGDPGIGKSRLTREFAKRSQLRRAHVLWGACIEHEAAPPYLPFVEGLRALLEGRGTSLLENLNQLDALVLPILTHMLPQLAIHLKTPQTPQAPPDRYTFFEAVASLLRAAAKEHPLVLVLEDLHWADKPSLLLLEHLLHMLHDTRLLVIGTYRHLDVDEQHPLHDLITSMHRTSHITRLQLDGLSASQIQSMLDGLNLNVPSHRNPQLAEAIFSHSSGNPFFVNEILKDLVEAGSLADPNAISTRNLRIPQSVKEIINRRLRRLSDGCRELLTVASAMRHSFVWDVLVSAFSDSLDEDTLLDQLDEALCAQVINEADDDKGGTYTFTHALYGSTLYEALSTPRRKRLHAKIARAMEDALSPQRADEQLAEIAFHYCEAVNARLADKAIDYTIHAGTRSSERLAYEEAALHFTKALELLNTWKSDDPAHPSLQVQLLTERGRALASVGEWHNAIICIQQALELLPPQKQRKRAELLLELCSASLWAMDPVRILQTAQQACELSSSLQEPQLEAAARLWLTLPMLSQGKLSDAVEIYDKYERLVQDQHLAPLATKSIVLYWRGHHQHAITHAQHVIDTAERANDLPTLLFALCHKGLALGSIGQYDAALQTFTQTRELSQRHTVRIFLARSLSMSVSLHLDLFDLVGAEAIANEACEYASSIGFDATVISTKLDLIRMYVQTGRLERAEETIQELQIPIEHHKGFHRWLWDLRLTSARAELALARKQWHDAITLATSALAKNQSPFRPKYGARNHHILARAHAALGQHEHALQEFDTALAIARKAQEPTSLCHTLAHRLAFQQDEALQHEISSLIRQMASQLSDPTIRARFCQSPILQLDRWGLDDVFPEQLGHTMSLDTLRTLTE